MKLAEFEAEQAQCVFGAEFSSRTEFFLPNKARVYVTKKQLSLSFVLRRVYECVGLSFSAVSLCELHVFAMEVLRSLRENSFSLSLASSLVFAGRAVWWAFEELLGASLLRSPSRFPVTAFIKRTFIAQTKNILLRSCIYFTSFNLKVPSELSRKKFFFVWRKSRWSLWLRTLLDCHPRNAD